jgi:hypothetical protein
MAHEKIPHEDHEGVHSHLNQMVVTRIAAVQGLCVCIKTRDLGLVELLVRVDGEDTSLSKVRVEVESKGTCPRGDDSRGKWGLGVSPLPQT